MKIGDYYTWKTAGKKEYDVFQIEEINLKDGLVYIIYPYSNNRSYRVSLKKIHLAYPMKYMNSPLYKVLNDS